MPNHKYIYLAIVVLCFIAFSPVFSADFINYDDPDYVINNAYIREISFENIKQIFSGKATLLYVPLALLSYMLEYAIFDAGAKAFHVVNVLLHIINVILLYKILLKLEIKNTYLVLFALAFFALNPLVTESVCWITERKDVLYTLFYFLATLRFLNYQATSHKKDLSLTLLFFVLACLSKPMAVTLPVLFGIYLIYKEKKIQFKKHLYLIPFFLVSLVFSVVAMVSINNGQTGVKIINHSYSIPERVVIFFSELGYYFFKPFFPFRQQLINLFPEPSTVLQPGALLYFAVSGILLSLAIAYLFFKHKNRLVLFSGIAWLCFLLPVLQIHSNTHSYTSERYFYVSLVFPVTIVFALLNNFKIKEMTYRFALSALILLFVTLTFNRSSTWKNTETLFTEELKTEPGDALALNNLGYYYNSLGKFARAEQLLKQAVTIDSYNAYYLNNYGWALAGQGKYDSAIVYLKQAVNISPAYAEAFGNLGICYMSQGKETDAFNCFNEAYMCKPDNAENLYNLGAWYLKTGQKQKALPLLKRSYDLGNKKALNYLR